jgi:hypothetical protein
LKRTKDQSVGPLGDKRDDEDLKEEEPTPNPKGLHSQIVHQKRKLLNIDADPSLNLFENPIPDPIKFPGSDNTFM